MAAWWQSPHVSARKVHMGTPCPWRRVIVWTEHKQDALMGGRTTVFWPPWYGWDRVVSWHFCRAALPVAKGH
jgi:hypothetical protein